MTRLIAGLIGLTALTAPSVASAYGPDCQATAELHYAIAQQLSYEGLLDGPNAGDTAWEDSIAACEGETPEAAARELALTCETPTAWHMYAPGGWVAVCGEDEGAELYRVAP